MMIAARSPGNRSASSSARASGAAISLKSEYVSRVLSLSRSDSIRQVSFGQRSSASRSAAPRHVYWSRFSIQISFHHRGSESLKEGNEASSPRGLPAVRRHKPAMLISFSRCLACRVVNRASQPRLNSRRQGPEIRHPLQFVVRQLHVKMILQSSQQIERLQAVNTQGLEEVVIRRELLARHLEVPRRQAQNFIQRLSGRV